MRFGRRRLDRRMLTVLPVVADGALAVHGTGGGRVIPVGMVDLSAQPELRELIRLHEHLGPGDCRSLWTRPRRNRDELRLALWFERPIDLAFIMAFDLTRFHGLVDQLVRANGFYLQHGVAGSLISTTPRERRLLIEVPSSDFSDRWDKVFRSTMTREFRRHGMNRRRALSAADEYIVELRGQLSLFRLG